MADGTGRNAIRPGSAIIHTTRAQSLIRAAVELLVSSEGHSAARGDLVDCGGGYALPPAIVLDRASDLLQVAAADIRIQRGVTFGWDVPEALWSGGDDGGSPKGEEAPEV